MTTLASIFFDRLNAGDAAGAVALTTDDFSWTVAGKSDGPFSLAGTYDRDRFLAMLGSVGSILPAGPVMDITSVTAGEQSAVVEAHVTGDTADGRHYDNRLAYAFDYRDGRISAVREYLDTAHAAEVFG